jgi:hypothetical protein
MLARFITLMTVALLVFAGSAFADTEGMATAHVYVNVNPNVSVGVITPNVDLFGIQTGIINGQIIYRIDANSEQVCLSVGPTYLYKGDDPTDPMVAPILLSLEDGVLIEPTDANPLAGGSPVADYMFVYNYNGFAGMQTEFICYESSQPGYFSQDVYVTVWWDQDDPEKPQGEYSGFVTLCAGFLGPVPLSTCAPTRYLSPTLIYPMDDAHLRASARRRLCACLTQTYENCHECFCQPARSPLLP